MIIVSTDERFSTSLQYIEKRLGGTINIVRGRHELAVPAKEIRKLKDVLADVIVTDCKTYYIASRLKLPLGDPVALDAFIKILSLFDRETDKIIAKTIIKITPQFHLDSFFEFMLDVLKSRWDEVCLLANENTHYLVCRKTFLELLHFLVSNLTESDEKLPDDLAQEIDNLFTSAQVR